MCVCVCVCVSVPYSARYFSNQDMGQKKEYNVSVLIFRGFENMVCL